MHRRDFLKCAVAGAAWAGLPLVRAGTVPWSLGFDGVAEDLPPLDMQVQGRIPEACYGRMYRNGPALYQRGAQRYQHWFDPDGMVQQFQLGPAGVSHRGSFVRTRKFQAEQAAGKFLFDGAGTRFEEAYPVRNNEDSNVANINVQPFDGELLALWEAGSPYRLDPDSLRTREQLHWSEELSGVPFSAHPRFDERGDMWNIGSISFAAAPRVVLYHCRPGQGLVKSRVHTLDFPGYMHDFILTPRHLVVLNSSALLGDGDTFVDRIHWQPTQPSQLLVFDRENFDLLRVVEVPATFVFHFGNAWEDAAGIHFGACAYPDTGLVKLGMRRLAQRREGPYHDDAALVRYDLDLRKGRAAVEQTDVKLEFPGFDRRRPFAVQPLIGVGGTSTSESGLSAAIVRVDPRSGARDQYDYGPGVIVEEPLRVADGDGAFIVHSFLDYRRARSGIAVLREDRLREGPVATATMERVLPLGFHGCFLPA